MAQMEQPRLPLQLTLPIGGDTVHVRRRVREAKPLSDGALHKERLALLNR